MSSAVDSFNFTTQDHESLGLNDLKGEWWIAYFLYTDCKMVCPTTTPNMMTVQNQLKDYGLTPQIIAFSVDPDNDTPDVLSEYANEYEIDLANWDFLTGYEFAEIRELSLNSFKSALEDGGPEEHAFAHSTSFFLVSPDSEVIKRYDGMSTNEADLLVDDLRRVMN